MVWALWDISHNTLNNTVTHTSAINTATDVHSHVQSLRCKRGRWETVSVMNPSQSPWQRAWRAKADSHSQVPILITMWSQKTCLFFGENHSSTPVCAPQWNRLRPYGDMQPQTNWVQKSQTHLLLFVAVTKDSLLHWRSSFISLSIWISLKSWRWHLNPHRSNSVKQDGFTHFGNRRPQTCLHPFSLPITWWGSICLHLNISETSQQEVIRLRSNLSDCTH